MNRWSARCVSTLGIMMTPRRDAAPTLLLVEDEPTLAAAVAARLRAEGFQVQVCADGPTAVEAAAQGLPDLVVLDVMLPGYDGLEVCRRIQAARPVPVLMLTARDDETDKLIGLAVGADDYLTKPFSMRELVARVHALLRRVRRAAELAASEAESPPQRVGELEIDRAGRRVRLSGNDVHLTPLEFDLLACLARQPHAVLSREQLLEQVWDWADASGTRTVDSHVKALRRKLGPDLIRTVHGVGYGLQPS
jgi:DNA-binding response OmpR family regulator